MLTPEDLKLIRYCKFYMALMANEVLKESPITEICAAFGNCNRGQVQSVQQQAMNYSGMMAAFCERLCWTDYSVLFLRISDKINWQVKEELLDLMQIPSLRPERARSLYEADFKTVESIVEMNSPDQMVKIFAKNDGFITHRKSNSDDLRIKYDYLYSLAHKVLSEAKTINLKRKFDPDCTMQNYL
jgi:DNA polymerase theta